jgi:subtilase family serine protease
MKKTVFSISILLVLGACSSNETIKKDEDIQSAIEAGGENDASYTKENAAELAKIEKELAEEAASLTTLKVDKIVHDFGTVLLGSENTCSFKVTNTGNKPLLIADVQASCGCTTPEKPERPIAPGKSDIIKVGFKPNSQSIDKKPISKTVTITANTEPRLTVVTVKAIVE